jgi:hypothetical protein
MAKPSPDSIGRVIAATFGLLGGGAVGFWLQVNPPVSCCKRCARVDSMCVCPGFPQKKLMDEERAARDLRIKARMERLRVRSCKYCAGPFVLGWWPCRAHLSAKMHANLLLRKCVCENDANKGFPACHSASCARPARSCSVLASCRRWKLRRRATSSESTGTPLCLS